MNDIQQHIDRIFQAQIVNHRVVGKSTAMERISKLKDLQNWIIDNREEIRQAVHQDFSKPAAEVDLSEIWVLVTEIRHVCRHLKKWMRPKKVKPTLAVFPAKGWIQYEPKGVTLIIAPWNFPFNLTISPLISALAAGNCAVIKPSELTPNSSSLMEKMVKELFEEKEVALFQGDKDVAEILLGKPFHHIFFTGSTRVGRIVMTAAAKHLASVTLELGGKSPTIVDESADLEDAADKITWGKFLNSGQICLAPDYLLVQESVAEKFITFLQKSIAKKFGKEPQDIQVTPDFARVVNKNHYQRLSSLMDAAIEAGASIDTGGEKDEKSRYIAPTIFTNVQADSPLMEEEIFGPLLPIMTFRSLEEVINLINSKPKPLGIYLFSQNQKNIKQILSNTSAGGTAINDVLTQFLHMNLPFGGVNASGFGKTHGIYGFKAFSNERAVLKNIRRSPLKVLYPPYTPRVQKLIDLVLKYL